MSKKHHQRTRAEILAKRAAPIKEVHVQRKEFLPNGQTLYFPVAKKVRKSKYVPHIGAKERERAKLRCYMLYSHGSSPGEMRSAPCMMQTSKSDQLPF